MALRIEYETHYGITCEYAHCVVVDVRCSREGDTYPVKYNGKIYASESAYNNGSSPIGGFNGRFELDQAATKQQYNIVKQSYLHLKEQEGFADGVDC